MKAIVTTKYGPPEVLELREVEKPTPGDNEVRIKIHASTVTAGDCEMRSLKLPLGYQLVLRMGFGFTKPRREIPGSEVAGEIEAIGKDVKKLKIGDQVFGTYLRQQFPGVLGPSQLGAESDSLFRYPLYTPGATRTVSPSDAASMPWRMVG